MHLGVLGNEAAIGPNTYLWSCLRSPGPFPCLGGLKACAGLSLPGKPKDRDSPDNGGDSFESSDSLLRSWNSQSSLLDVQRVPSFESFEDDCSQSLGLSKPTTMSFKDYIQERSDPVEQGKPVIPAAVLAGFTGECSALGAPGHGLIVHGRPCSVFTPVLPKRGMAC